MSQACRGICGARNRPIRLRDGECWNLVRYSKGTPYAPACCLVPNAIMTSCQKVGNLRYSFNGSLSPLALDWPVPSLNAQDGTIVRTLLNMHISVGATISTSPLMSIPWNTANRIALPCHDCKCTRSSKHVSSACIL